MMSQITVSPASVLKNYYNSICRTAAPVSHRLVEEIETFVLAHRQHWSSSDLPVLISLSSRIKKLTGVRSSISAVMDSILVVKDGPIADQARQALYQLFSRILEKKESFQNQNFAREIGGLWKVACSSEKLFWSGETRAILHKLQSELSENTDEAAVQLLNEMRTLLENCPQISLNLNPKVHEHFRKSLLCLIEKQANKQLEEILKDPVLSCEEKEQALDACEGQVDQKLASLDQEVLECTELLGNCFSFAASSDAAFAALNLEAQQFLFKHGFEMLTTMRERFPFLTERQYYPELMERVEKRLHSMELNWNPFPLLGDDLLLNIASYLPLIDLQRWTASHRFLHDYFKGAIFCEDITSSASSRDYQEALDRQHAYLKEIRRGSSYAWACQMGERIKGLSLKKFTAEKIDLDLLLEKCPNLVALDLRGISFSELPFNILQLKFLVLPQDVFLKNRLLPSLNFFGFKQDAEDPQVFMRDSPIVDGNEMTIETGEVAFNPSYLLSPSLERLTLTGYWRSFKLRSFFNQLKERCPNLQYLDAGKASGIHFLLFHLDLTWIKGLEFPQSDRDLTPLFSLLRTCGLVSATTPKNHPSHVWKKADFVPEGTLKLEQAEALPGYQYAALRQLYPRLETLRIESDDYRAKTPPAIWNLISATTQVEILVESLGADQTFIGLQKELKQLGFSKKISTNDVYAPRQKTIAWINPNNYFTIDGMSLERLDEILRMSPENFKIGLPLLNIPSSPQQLKELSKLKNLLSKHGIESLCIDRLEMDSQYINDLSLLLAIAPQVTVNEVKFTFLSPNMQLDDIAPFLQQQQVERLVLSGCRNPVKADQLIGILIDNCEQFPSLVEIIGPYEGILPEAWILKGWFPSIQGNFSTNTLSRNPIDVTLSTQMAETLTEKSLLNLLGCSQLRSIDLRGQPVSEQFAKVLLDRPLKKLLVSPELDEKIFFLKMLAAVEPGIVFKNQWSWKSVNYLQVSSRQGRHMILTDDDILAMVKRFPSLAFLHLENVDLSQITAVGIRALLKLKLEEVTLGASSLSLINVLLSLNTLRSLHLHTEKLPDLDLGQFTNKICSKGTHELHVQVTKFHPICLLLLKHPLVAHMEFEQSMDLTIAEKKAIAKIGYQLKKNNTGMSASRASPPGRQIQGGFMGRDASFFLQDSALKEVALIWFGFHHPSIESLVCTGENLSDQGLLLLPSMKSLTLKNTVGVTFNGLITYLQKKPSLQTLRINNNLSSDQLSQLKSLGWEAARKRGLFQEFDRINFNQ